MPKSTPNSRQAKWKDHYNELLLFLYLCRFATTKQLCRRFPSVYSGKAAERSCNRDLQQLRELNCIKTKDYRSINPTLPSAHFIRAGGVRRVNKQYNLVFPAKDEIPPKHERLQHELGITQFAVALSESVSSRDDISVKQWEQRYGQASNALEFTKPDDGELGELQPDASFMLLHQRNEPNPHVLLHFVEVDRGNMAPAVVYHKLRFRYGDWYESSQGQQYLADRYREFNRDPSRLIFRLLLIVHGSERYASVEARLAHLYTESLRLPDHVRNTLWFTTANDLESPGAIAAPIWQRGRDAAKWKDDYQVFNATLPSGGRKATKARQQYVARHLAVATKTCLLPDQTKSSVGSS